MTFAALAGHRITHMTFGFALMGAWAWFANRTHPMPAPIIAGIVQGSLSAVLTLMFKAIMDWILPLLIRLPLLRVHTGIGTGLAIAVPTATVFLLSNAILRMAHGQAGTPEVGATIVVPIFAVSLYALVYSTIRWRRMQTI